MGKEKPGFLTPKAIANRIKSKGLQKLRWYCQMCQKQCRDENGFKCHTMSESHQRQLLLFGENANKFMDEFSGEFNKVFLNTLKRRFGTKRVHANIVYQEYINDRNHIHMNATRWLTLTDYVKWLGRKGICIVEETEKGWFITYIDRDPETLRRQEEIEKKKKLDLDDRQRQEMFLQKQMERAKEQESTEVITPTELKKTEDEVIKINFKKSKPIIKSNKDEEKNLNEEKIEFKQEFLDEDNKSYEDDGNNENKDQVENESKKREEIKEEKIEFKEPYPLVKKEEQYKPSTFSNVKPSTSSSVASVFKVPEKRKSSALDDIIAMEEKKREKLNRKDYWLHKNIVVKITTNKLGEKFYKKKAIVMDVIDNYTGVVKLLDSGTVIKLDQAHLETVLPAIGKNILVLNGAYRGELAVLEQINEKDFSAKISILAGPLKGRIINGVQYDDISKYYQEE